MKPIDLKKYPDELIESLYREIKAEIQRRSLQSKMTAVEHVKWLKRSGDPVYIGSDRTGRLSSKDFVYLDRLAGQDWSSLFPGGDENKVYYVYAHVYKLQPLKFDGEVLKLNMQGMPFYIGKGVGNRAYDLKRNQGHGVVLNELIRKGVPASDIVHIIKDGLTESEALQLESKLIYFFGTKYEGNKRGILVNLDIPKRPIFVHPEHGIKSGLKKLIEKGEV